MARLLRSNSPLPAHTHFPFLEGKKGDSYLSYPLF